MKTPPRIGVIEMVNSSGYVGRLIPSIVEMSIELHCNWSDRSAKLLRATSFKTICDKIYEGARDKGSILNIVYQVCADQCAIEKANIYTFEVFSFRCMRRGFDFSCIMRAIPPLIRLSESSTLLKINLAY